MLSMVKVSDCLPPTTTFAVLCRSQDAITAKSSGHNFLALSLASSLHELTLSKAPATSEQ
jgi:hypothetical protein